MALTKASSTVLGTDSVGTDQIEALAVDTAELAAEAVTTAKIEDEAVTTAKIADGAITAAKLASAVTGFDYDSGWVADWASAAQNFNHALNTTTPLIVQLQMKDGNDKPMIFSGSAPVTEHDGGAYTEGYGAQITIVDANNIIVQKQQVTGGNPEYWLPQQWAVAPNGWAGLQPTHLRLLIRTQ